MIKLIESIDKIDFKSTSKYLQNCFLIRGRSWIKAAANWQKNDFWLEAAAINGVATVAISILVLVVKLHNPEIDNDTEHEILRPSYVCVFLKTLIPIFNCRRQDVLVQINFPYVVDNI